MLFRLNMSEIASIYCHICILSQTCNFDTREGANNYMTGYYIFFIGTGFCSSSLTSFLLCCLNLLRASLRQSWTSNLVRERTIVLLLCEPRICRQMLDHGGNYTNLLSNIVPLLSTESILPLSSRRKLSFLFDSWLLLVSPLFHHGF